MSCDSVVNAYVWPEAKDPDDSRQYAVDFERKLTRYREAGKTYTAGTFVRLEKTNGFELECTTGGQTAISPPRYSSTIGATFTDGSVTWTVRAISTSSLYTTVSGTPTWTFDSGITASAATLSGQLTTSNLSGGVDGNDYTGLVKATLADGNSITAVCILKVRRAQRVCEA